MGKNLQLLSRWLQEPFDDTVEATWTAVCKVTSLCCKWWCHCNCYAVTHYGSCFAHFSILCVQVKGVFPATGESRLRLHPRTKDRPAKAFADASSMFVKPSHAVQEGPRNSFRVPAGSGSFGKVYFALNTQNGQEVAVKLEDQSGSLALLAVGNRVYRGYIGVILG